MLGLKKTLIQFSEFQAPSMTIMENIEKMLNESGDHVSNEFGCEKLFIG